jgi:hypothetical protein
MNRRILFSVVMALSLVVSLAFLLASASLASANSRNAKEGGDNKIIVTGLQPGESVYTYVNGMPFLTGAATGAPPGSFNAKVDSSGGGQVEVFAPVGKMTSVVVYNPATNMSRLIGVASPGTSEPDTILNAQQQLQLAGGPIPDKGLASPAQQSAQP